MQTTDKNNFLRAEAELVLDEARKAKAEKNKDLGAPIKLTGVALDIHIRENYAWIAENTAVARKLDLETGKTLQLFKGHKAPVTALVFYDKVKGSGDEGLLITGSWDKTIKIWDTVSKEVLSTTDAHADFVKALFILPSLELLVSSSSDKIVRFWDLSTFEEGKPLTSAGTISAHTRPVECLSAHPTSDSTAILYTADTMGVIKAWELSKETGPSPRWRTTLKEELNYHRTRVNDITYGNGQLWTASSDETAHVHYDPLIADKPDKPIPPITHATAVKAILPLSLTPLGEPYLLVGSGEAIYSYDISSPEEPELLGEIDAHWHDVIALRIWMRRERVEDGKIKVEPWVISTSLDGTVRKWRLTELLQPTPKPVKKEEPVEPKLAEKKEADSFGMTEEEERELAELMDDD